MTYNQREQIKKLRAAGNGYGEIAWHISKYGKVLLPQECYYIVSAAFLHDIHAYQEAENSSKKAPSKSQDLE